MPLLSRARGTSASPPRPFDSAGEASPDADSAEHQPLLDDLIDELSRALPPHDSYEGKHRWDPSATWKPEEEAAIVWRTDVLLLTWLCVMFFGLQLDRGNLANALTDNILDDLNLTTDDYNNGTAIQLITFIAAEFPAQLLVKRYGFKLVLPAMMVLWGTISWVQAWMSGPIGFYTARALIGVFEGGFVPGTILMASYFYTSKELSMRLAVFWTTLNTARIGSALLAAAILKMRGFMGMPGWFWLFLLEGLLTCVIGVMSYLYLPYSPTRTKGPLFRRPWYTEREEVIMVNRILRDDPAKGLVALDEPAGVADIINSFRDRSLWGLYLIGLVAYIPALPMQNYLAFIMKSMGFTTFESNLLTIPFNLLQIVLMLLLARSSEYFGERTLHCIIGEFWFLPMFTALLALPPEGHEWTRYALSTMVAGYPYFHPIVAAWISENTFDVKKRAVTAAAYNVIVQIGAVFGSQIYRTWDAPYYYDGNKLLVAICALSLGCFVATRQYLAHLNHQKRKVWDLMTTDERTAYRNDRDARERDGNSRLDFRFAL